MSESISDLIKMFRATNSLFEFEDTRIYRDHKNMVNRLNNCEIANQEKTIKSALSQLEDINYLEENDLLASVLFSFDDNDKLLIVSFKSLMSCFRSEINSDWALRVVFIELVSVFWYAIKESREVSFRLSSLITDIVSSIGLISSCAIN